ncbi:MAG: hypothetical protein K9H64_06715 [Bacteroidales bacterium]|nr:hypothetical protein [Bacteroidales bacterium]MCF8455383.1 hypothetical protein [Bacteroidales bacterium]
MKSKKYKPNKKKTFKQAIEATEEVRFCYKEGKSAILNRERNKVELSDPRKCGGSLFIDQCLIEQNLYAQDNRWDYAIDYNGEVFFFEVHTANTREVRTVLNKLSWLKDWLNQKAPEINILKAKTSFYWVQSNGSHILKNSSQEREVLQEGLKPISKLVLK